MSKISLGLLLFFTLARAANAQQIQKKQPKLVIEVVVEQLRYEMLERYWNVIGDNGFKRLIHSGVSFSNMQYDVMHVSNASGVTTIATGLPPSKHGVIGDTWFDPLTKMQQFACGHNAFEVFYAPNTYFSPDKLTVPSLGDMLKVNSMGKSKVIGISMNPVTAILGTGRTADMALWMNPRDGVWMTNAYYADSAIHWLDEFNAKDFHKLYASRTWTTYFDQQTYSASMPDDNPYEIGIPGYRKTFPYEMDFLRKRSESYKYLRVAPFGFTYTKDLALTALVREELGKDRFTDLLVVGFSNLAYAGKYFHARSMEMEDLFIRLDRTIAHLLRFIDQEFEKGEVLLVLTADRGMAENRNYLDDLGWNIGTFDGEKAQALLDTYLDLLYQKGDWIVGYANQQYYLNQQMLDKVKIPTEQVQRQAADFLSQFEGVATAYPLIVKWAETNDAYSNTVHPYRSGDVFVELLPGWRDASDVYLVKGQRSVFNNHVPLIIFGGKQPAKTISSPVFMQQLAPTLSKLIGIPSPVLHDDSLLPIIDK